MLSTLFQHEMKLSVNHFELKRFNFDQSAIETKSILEFHMGFRRYLCRPIFSEIIRNSKDKAKYLRFMRPDCMASVYSPITMPPGKVLVFKREPTKETDATEETKVGDEVEMTENENFEFEPKLIASGSIEDPDP